MDQFKLKRLPCPLCQDEIAALITERDRLRAILSATHDGLTYDEAVDRGCLDRWWRGEANALREQLAALAAACEPLKRARSMSWVEIYSASDRLVALLAQPEGPTDG